MKIRINRDKMIFVARPQKLISCRHLPIRWFLTVASVALFAVSGCTPLSRGDLFTEIDEVNTSGNHAPVANAGTDQVVPTGISYVLDGSASTDPDGDTIVYLWTFLAVPGGSVLNDAAIAGAATATASFTPDTDGTYTLQLQVDDSVDFDTDTVVITATTGNIPPTADAGADQNIYTGNPVNLDGSGSLDPDFDPLNYLWTFVSIPGGSILDNAAIAGAATAMPSFTPDVDGNYNLQLQVDDSVDFDNDNVVVFAVNAPPVADAGADVSTPVGNNIGLDGSGSNDLNPTDILTYSWNFLSVPGGSSLTDANITGANTATPTFIPDVIGDYELQLGVSDGSVNAIDQITVSADPPTLVGEWMFSGGLANDTGPFGYDGIVNGAVPTADRAANPNSAFYFDGVIANIVLGNGAELNYTDLMSFSCWLRADDLGNAGRLVSKRSSPVAAGWEINIGSTDKITTNRAGTVNAQVDTPGIIPGVWHHLAFTWEPSAAVEQIKLYLDGVYLSGAILYAGASLEPPVSSEPLTLGMPAYAAVLLFKGAIDDVRFYHRILSPVEVSALAAEPALP